MTKLLPLGILVSKTIRAVLVAKLIIIGTSSLTSFILALSVVLAKLVISGIYFIFNIFYLNIIYIFFKTSLLTKSPNLLKSTGTGNNLSTFSLSTLFFKLLKLVGTFFNWSISNLSKLDFELAKSTFLAKDYVSIAVKFFKSAFVV